MLAAIIPAVLSLPTTLLPRQTFIQPTCGAGLCLADTNYEFEGCNPVNAECLCSLDQSDIEDFVSVVEPCIDREVDVAEKCTAGGIYC
ncbi:hypothetical protein GQ44DRAFT_613730 [Phaeosphaeriaceae sp. PMI808]|nr:hypothetical protein GQ44DRAFT_613730 [Phaeosphaeriaceae sp. PMI808]